MSKPNIFDILNSVDENDFKYYSTLTPDDKKKFPSYMLLKWMACSNNKEKISKINATLNKWLFTINKNPELIYHIFAACGSGKRDVYKWKKKKPRNFNRPVTTELLKEYYNISSFRATEDSEVMNLESMIAIATELGHFDKIKKLKKEYTE
jgi:hypothetical protein